VIPILYLRGLSIGDAKPTLEQLLGEDTAELLPTTIAVGHGRGLLRGHGVRIGYANLVPVVVASGEEPVIPKLPEAIAECGISADAGRMISATSEEAVPP
jgi:hypothetical protein